MSSTATGTVQSAGIADDLRQKILRKPRTRTFHYGDGMTGVRLGKGCQPRQPIVCRPVIGHHQ